MTFETTAPLLLRSSWDEILVAKEVDERLEELQENGTIQRMFPSLQKLVGFGGGDSGHKDLWAHTKQVVKQTIPAPLLRWAALFHDVGKPISFTRGSNGKIAFHHHEEASARLFTKAAQASALFEPFEIAEITFVIRHLGHVEAYSSDWTDSAVRRLALELGEYLDAVFAVARADCTTARFSKREKNLGLTHELRTRIETLRAQDATPPALPSGLGDAIQLRLGLSPGRLLGEVMKDLKARVEAGELPRNAAIEVYLPHAKLPPTEP